MSTEQNKQVMLEAGARITLSRCGLMAHVISHVVLIRCPDGSLSLVANIDMPDMWRLADNFIRVVIYGVAPHGPKRKLEIDATRVEVDCGKCTIDFGKGRAIFHDLDDEWIPVPKEK